MELEKENTVLKAKLEERSNLKACLENELVESSLKEKEDKIVALKGAFVNEKRASAADAIAY
eukprot:5722213-Ditylum_brightwellii.AAC.1